MSFTRLSSVFGLMALSAVLSFGADVSGTWKGAFDFQGQSVPLTLTLKADGPALTGQIEGLPSGTVALHDGKVADGKVNFWVMTEYQGMQYKLIYKGDVSDNEIRFSFGTEGGEFSAELTAKRQQAATAGISGTWKGAFDLQGQSVPLTLALKQDGGNVTGTVDGLPAGTAQIKEGKLADGKVTFWLMSEYEGMPIKLVYNGSVGDGQISFHFGLEDGSWGADFVAKPA